MPKSIYTLYCKGTSCKDCVMKTVTNIQENAEDIYAEAQQINEERAQAEQENEIVSDDADKAEA